MTVLVAASITYASADGSTPASPAVHRAARPVHRAAPPAAPVGGRSAGGEKGEGRGAGGGDHGHGRVGKIYFNERMYSASAEGCITATGSGSFSVFNDSRRTVEVYRGFSCDDGAPVTTVGPHGETFGTVTRTGLGGVFGDDGVVGSFRVIGHHGEW
ncbi:hypothetical protein [Streptomyces sp. MMG1121]|uniref:hypothetical protein n=1 Tax=Streptomyces sp. MMG1121 TaxID=1415544 RepID=UPI0006AFE134|nr:hypothetical protein [Streptomyces sp. MMG1121]